MESTIKIAKNSLCFFLLTLFQGCWTSESDITEVDKLVSRFKVIYNKNDTRAGYILSLNSGNGSYQYIEKRCKRIYFDSTDIFVQFTWHDADTTHHYSRIKILNNENVSYQKQELSSKDFYERIKTCKDCVEIIYDKLK